MFNACAVCWLHCSYGGRTSCAWLDREAHKIGVLFLQYSTTDLGDRTKYNRYIISICTWLSEVGIFVCSLQAWMMQTCGYKARPLSIELNCRGTWRTAHLSNCYAFSTYSTPCYYYSYIQWNPSIPDSWIKDTSIYFQDFFKRPRHTFSMWKYVFWIECCSVEKSDSHTWMATFALILRMHFWKWGIERGGMGS